MTNPTSQQCPECGMRPSFDGMWHKPGCSQPTPITSNERLETIKQSPRQASVDDVEWLCDEIDRLNGDSPPDSSVEQEFHNIDDVAEIRRLRAALELIAGTNGTECAMPRALAAKALSGSHPRTRAQGRAGRAGGVMTDSPRSVTKHLRRINWGAVFTLLFAICCYALPTQKGREWTDYALLVCAGLSALMIIQYWRNTRG